MLQYSILIRLKRRRNGRRAVLKKRLAALVLAALVLLQLPAPAAAADSVYFTAANETIMELSDATMPFWSGGYLYVSSSVFSNKDLGVYYSFNAAKHTVVLYTTSRALIFNLTDGTVTDGQGNGYYPAAATRSSGVFLPVSTVTTFFGLTYSTSKVSHGMLLRIRSASSVLPDSMFLDAAASQLEYRYSQYTKASAPPQTPTIPSTVTGNDDTPDETPIAGKTLYLCFYVTDADRAGTLLDVLDAAGARATFYFSGEQLAASGDLLRRMIATGQTVGLAADAAAGDAAGQLQKANEALRRAGGEKSRLACVLNGTSVSRNAVEAAGYRCLSADLNRASAGLNGTASAAALLKRVTARTGSVSVWLSDNVNRSGLKAFLTSAAAADDRCLGLTETVR